MHPHNAKCGLNTADTCGLLGTRRSARRQAQLRAGTGNKSQGRARSRMSSRSTVTLSPGVLLLHGKEDKTLSHINRSSRPGVEGEAGSGRSSGWPCRHRVRCTEWDTRHLCGGADATCETFHGGFGRIQGGISIRRTSCPRGRSNRGHPG